MRIYMHFMYVTKQNINELATKIEEAIAFHTREIKWLQLTDNLGII